MCVCTWVCTHTCEYAHTHACAMEKNKWCCAVSLWVLGVDSWLGSKHLFFLNHLAGPAQGLFQACSFTVSSFALWLNLYLWKSHQKNVGRGPKQHPCYLSACILTKRTEVGDLFRSMAALTQDSRTSQSVQRYGKAHNTELHPNANAQTPCFLPHYLYCNLQHRT